MNWLDHWLPWRQKTQKVMRGAETCVKTEDRGKPNGGVIADLASEILAGILLSGPGFSSFYNRCREAAESVLKESDPESRAELVESIGEKETLAILAIGATEEVDRLAAVRKLEDQRLLAAISKSRPFFIRCSDLVCEAASRVVDPALQTEIARETQNPETRKIVVDQITDDRLLSDLACSPTCRTMQTEIVARIANEEILAELARSRVPTALERLTDSKLIEALAVSGVASAVPRLTDPRLIEKLAISGTSSKVRLKAIERCNNETVLVEIAMAAQDSSERIRATDRIMNQDALFQVYLAERRFQFQRLIIPRVTAGKLKARITAADVELSTLLNNIGVSSESQGLDLRLPFRGDFVCQVLERDGFKLGPITEHKLCTTCQPRQVDRSYLMSFYDLPSEQRAQIFERERFEDFANGEVEHTLDWKRKVLWHEMPLCTLDFACNYSHKGAPPCGWCVLSGIDYRNQAPKRIEFGEMEPDLSVPIGCKIVAGRAWVSRVIVAEDVYNSPEARVDLYRLLSLLETHRKELQ